MENRDDISREMPFYMTYPMQNLYMAEMEYEKDLERMMDLYPMEVNQLRQMVEERCDELECEGSRIYDENPDRRMIEEEVRRLLERFLRELLSRPVPQPSPPRPEPVPRPTPRPEPVPRPMPRPEPVPRPMPRPEPVPRPMPMQENGMPMQDNGMRMQEYESDTLYATNYGYSDDNRWLRSLIGVLFNNEIYRRRCRNRRCRRWW